MTSTTTTISDTVDVPEAVRRAAAALSVAVAVGVLLQSVFAGGFLRAVYSDAAVLGSSLTWHELGANATFGALLLEGLLVLATPLRRDRTHLGSGLLLGVLLTSVIGLGYVGGASVAVHVPLAMATFGAALWHALVANGIELRRR